MTLWVTTSLNAGQAQHDRASLVTQRCKGTRMSLTGTRAVDALASGETLYVVGRNRDELRAPGGTLFVHQGLLKPRLYDGVDHPLIRALTDGNPATCIVDGTIGLAGDSLHIAGALACRVVGIEASHAIYSLLEEGIARLAGEGDPVSRCAKAIELHHGDCAEVMASFPEDSADAVLLAPMYDSPDKAAPGFQLLRSVAVYDPVSEVQLRAGLRIAPRVVVKWPAGVPRPPALDRFCQVHCIEGQRVNYWQVSR